MKLTINSTTVRSNEVTGFEINDTLHCQTCTVKYRECTVPFSSQEGMNHQSCVACSFGGGSIP